MYLFIQINVIISGDRVTRSLVLWFVDRSFVLVTNTSCQKCSKLSRHSLMNSQQLLSQLLQQSGIIPNPV
jgi:hypothetical protein